MAGPALPDAFVVKGRLLSLLFIILVTGTVRIPLLNIPFERDEGEYAYIAWRMDYKEVPYRDNVDQKPPGTFWVYRMAINLPFGSVQAVHFAAMLFVIASAYSLYSLACLFTGQFWAAIAACLFSALLSDPLIYGTEANTEIFMLLPLILAQRAFFAALPVEGRQKGWDAFYVCLCGALTGAATAFKQVAFLNWPFLIALYPLFIPGENRWKRTAWFGILSTIGLFLVWGLIVVYFAEQNALKDFIYSVFTHNLAYIQAVPLRARILDCMEQLQILAKSESVAWAFCAAGFVFLWRARRVKLLIFSAGWLLTSFAGVSASGYYFPHYFQQMLPPLCLVAALGAEWFAAAPFWGLLPFWPRRAAAAVLLAVLPGIVLFPFLSTYTPDEAVRIIYPGNRFFAEMRELGARIAEMTNPEDRVYVFGAEPEVLFYARRASATRYIFLFPLYGPYEDAHQNQVTTANQIYLNHPAAIVFAPNGLTSIPGADQYLTEFTKSYMHSEFIPKIFVTLDEEKKSHILMNPNPKNPVPTGQEAFAVVFFRRHK